MSNYMELNQWKMIDGVYQSLVSSSIFVRTQVYLVGKWTQSHFFWETLQIFTRSKSRKDRFDVWRFMKDLIINGVNET